MKISRILIVDDEPQARRVLRVALAAQGFEVNDARSGEEALEKLREEPLDVILLDLKIPGMGGIEACREIRASSEAPVIVVSARKSAQERTEAFEAGADQYISKPCDIQELLARIRAVTRRVASFRPRLLVWGEVEVDFETHEVKRPDSSLRLTAKESTCCTVWHRAPTRWSLTGVSCKPCGGPTTATRWSTCGCSSINCARRSSPIPPTRSTSSRNRRPGIAYTFRRTSMPRTTPGRRAIRFSLRRLQARGGKP